MGIWHELTDILALLLGSLLLGTLLERIRQSALIGFILAGTLLGPHVFNVVQSSDEVRILAELGVSLLLFSIGLEFSRSRLASLRSAGTIGAFQIIGTGAVGTAGAVLCGLGMRESVAVGAIFSLSSTACVLHVLTKGSRLDSVPGRNALGVLLVQDIAVIPLAFLMEFLAIGPEATPGEAGPVTVLLGAVGFGVALWAALRFIAPLLLGSRVLSGNRELSLLLAVVTGLGAATGAHLIGVSPALGAFIAGLVLAGSPFAVQIRSDVGSLKTLLLTLFFGSIGMLANPIWIWEHLGTVLGLLAALIIGKTLVVALIVRAISGRLRHGLSSGLALAQIGEFSFLLVELGRGTVISEVTNDYLLSVTLLSLLFTPYLVRSGPAIERLLLQSVTPEPEADAASTVAAKVLLIGFGPAGQRAAGEIASTGHSIVVNDLNATSISRARELGYEGIVGDAGVPELLEHLDFDALEMVVITLPDPNTVVRVLQVVKQLRPGLSCVVRARYHMHRSRYEEFPGVVIVDEEEEVGTLLGEAAAECLGQKRSELEPKPEDRSVVETE